MGSFKIFNKFLGKAFGLGIYSIPKKQTFSDSTKEVSTLLIEFMGPSGVGKTTLRDHFLKNTKLNFPYKIYTEKDVSRLNYSIDERNIAGSMVYDQLYSRKLETISGKKDNYFKKNRQIQLFYKTLTDDFLIRNHLKEKCVILDQHVFKFFTEDFIPLTDSKYKKDFLKKRIIIYCYASPAIILKYIQKRSAEGKTRFGHQDKEIEKLYSDIQKHLEVRKTQISTLKEYGSSIISINTENSLEENSGLLDDFIGNQLKNKMT